MCSTQLGGLIMFEYMTAQERLERPIEDMKQTQGITEYLNPKML